MASPRLSACGSVRPRRRPLLRTVQSISVLSRATGTPIERPRTEQDGHGRRSKLETVGRPYRAAVGRSESPVPAAPSTGQSLQRVGASRVTNQMERGTACSEGEALRGWVPLESPRATDGVPAVDRGLVSEVRAGARSSRTGKPKARSSKGCSVRPPLRLELHRRQLAVQLRSRHLDRRAGGSERTQMAAGWTQRAAGSGVRCRDRTRVSAAVDTSSLGDDAMHGGWHRHDLCCVPFGGHHAEHRHHLEHL